MTAGTMLVGAASNGTALWYLTRATGLVALVLLTATVVLGVVASVGWTTERWPRFLSQTVHRNLSLFCVGFVAIHVITTVSDGYVPIGFADAFIPFRTPYRPLYVGLGALCFDLLVAVLVTSALRHRIGFASWRFVHWLAYLCWPIAMFHSLGSGSDSRVGLVQALDVVCAVAVFASVFWRLWTGRSFSEGRRAAAAVATVVVGMGLLVFAALGPLRPGWSHRSGTSPALLAQLAQKYSGSNTASGGPAPAGTPAASTTTAAGSGTAPTPPFTVGVTGTQTTAGPDGQGNEQVTLSMHLRNAASTPLTVVLSGSATANGGVAMSSGTVTLGSTHGAVTSLSGGTLTAALSGPTPTDLTLSLQVNQNSGALAGTASATADHEGDGDSH
jgi:DMSO/TMAO reductase YedYZ heme-binding membrane subunit